MNTKQLPYFIAIAKTGSLSKAAEQVQVSSAALSKYLYELEQSLQVTMFTRKGRRLFLTNAGRIYLKKAEEILDIQQQTIASIRHLNMESITELRFGHTPHRGSRMIASLYPKFIQKFHSVRLVPVEGYITQLREYLRAKEISFALATCLDYEPEPEFIRIPMFREECLLSVPAFHPLAYRSTSDRNQLAKAKLSDFKDSPFILMDDSTSIGKASLRLFRGCSFTPSVIHSSQNVIIVDSLIRSGAGIGLIPEYYAVPSSEVVYFRLKDPCFMTACILAHPDHHFSYEERYFIYLRLKELDAHPYYHLCQSPYLQRILDDFDSCAPLF